MKPINLMLRQLSSHRPVPGDHGGHATVQRGACQHGGRQLTDHLTRPDWKQKMVISMGFHRGKLVIFMGFHRGKLKTDGDFHGI